MFRLAHEDPGRWFAYANRLIPAAAAMAGLGGLALVLAAGLLPLVFGERYAELPLVVRLTAVFPLFAGVYGIWTDALSAKGGQRHRLALVCVSLVPTTGRGDGTWAGGGAALARVAVMGIAAALAWAALPRRS